MSIFMSTRLSDVAVLAPSSLKKTGYNTFAMKKELKISFEMCGTFVRQRMIQCGVPKKSVTIVG